MPCRWRNEEHAHYVSPKTKERSLETMQSEKEYPFLTADMVRDWTKNSDSWPDGQSYDFDLYGIDCTLWKDVNASRPYGIFSENPIVSMTYRFFDVATAIVYLFNHYGDIGPDECYRSLEDVMKKDSWFEEQYFLLEYIEIAKSTPDVPHLYTLKGDVDDNQLKIIDELLIKNEFIPSDVGISDINGWCRWRNPFPFLKTTNVPPADDAMTADELIKAFERALNGWKKVRGDMIPGKRPYVVTVSEARPADVLVWATNSKDAEQYAVQQHKKIDFDANRVYIKSASSRRIATADDMVSGLQQLITEE